MIFIEKVFNMEMKNITADEEMSIRTYNEYITKIIISKKIIIENIPILSNRIILNKTIMDYTLIYRNQINNKSKRI